MIRRLAYPALATMALLGSSAPVAPGGTLVVSNMNDHTATVIDAASGRVRATLPTGVGPHEVAVSHDGKWAVVSNYGVRGQPGHSMTLIDVVAATVARTIDLGSYQRPHGAVFLPGDTVLAVTSEVSQAVLLIDLRNDHVIDVRPTRGRASHMLALTRSGDRVYTTNIVDGTVSRIDFGSRDSARVFPVAAGVEGIALTPDGGTVWVGSNRDSIVVIVDGERGTLRDTLRGFGMPYRIGISPNGALAVVSDPVRAEVRIFDVATHRERHRVVVSGDSLVATAEVPGSPSPEGVAISADSQWAYVTLQGRNRVATIDLRRGVIVGYAVTGSWSDGVGFSPVVGR